MAVQLMMMMMILGAASLLTIFPHSSSALPPETVSNAADTLSSSGYVAMSLTLTVVSDVLLSDRNSATIFTPPDSSFSDHGQPSLELLQIHFSPLAFSLSSLRSLPYGTKIPTMSSTRFLTITTPSSSSSSSSSSPSDEFFSINDVKILGSPIFDDGSLIVFGIESFFDPNFTVPDAPAHSPSFEHCTAAFGGYSNFSFHDAANVLVSRGYSVMASFLNLQLLGFLSQPTLTVFAPVDEVMIDYSGRFPDYSSLFLRHVLPCKISFSDLINVDDGNGFDTYLDGFKIKINRSGGTFKVNEVSITFPDMYNSDWFVIHGIREVLSLPVPSEEENDGDGDPFDEIPAKTSAGTILVATGPDRSEF